MEAKTIEIRVTPEAAQAYESASLEDRRSHESIMDEIGRKAKKLGMTPEILESILICFSGCDNGYQN